MFSLNDRGDSQAACSRLSPHTEAPLRGHGLCCGPLLAPHPAGIEPRGDYQTMNVNGVNVLLLPSGRSEAQTSWSLKVVFKQAAVWGCLKYRQATGTLSCIVDLLLSFTSLCSGSSLFITTPESPTRCTDHRGASPPGWRASLRPVWEGTRWHRVPNLIPGHAAHRVLQRSTLSASLERAAQGFPGHQASVPALMSPKDPRLFTLRVLEGGTQFVLPRRTS